MECLCSHECELKSSYSNSSALLCSAAEGNTSGLCGELLPQAGHLLHERRNVRQPVVGENKSAQIFHVADGFWQARDFVPLQPQRMELLHSEEVTGS